MTPAGVDLGPRGPFAALSGFAGGRPPGLAAATGTGLRREITFSVMSRLRSAATITPAETAHRSASVGQLGLIAIQTGRTLRWDPATETIADDPGATALLGRAHRQPWGLL